MMLAFIGLALIAQSFDAATIKTSAGGPPRTSIGPNRVAFGHATLKTALGRAYGVQFPAQIEGPAWIAEERYDINAIAHEGTSRAELLVMLQTLLTERFSLKLHRESRSIDGYVLVARGKPKLDPTSSSAESISMNGGRREARAMSMSSFTTFLSLTVQRPVLDETGLAGGYDFHFELSSEETRNPDAPSIFTIVGGLGLKLEPRAVKLDVIVVESGNKHPVEN